MLHQTMPLMSRNWFCRKVPDRPRDPAKWNEIADVVSALSVPVIANGDVFEYDDIQRIKSATGEHEIPIHQIFGYVLLLL